MNLKSNVKAISTFMIIILIVISAVIGGIISYMFTIAQFTELPEKTTLAITGVYFDVKNASAFTVSVLNPSYSPTDANITKIAISLKEEAQLYDVIATSPSIRNGIVIQIGEVKNITCFNIRKDGKAVTWGRFVYEYSGREVVVHVFSSNAFGDNAIVTLPFVKLEVIPHFDSEATFQNFSLTLRNHEKSETNLTITSIELVEPVVNRFRTTPYVSIPDDVIPKLPYSLSPGENCTFTCKLDWFGINETKISVSTKEGYEVYNELKLPQIFFEIKNVTFNMDYTDRFYVTVVNHPASADTATIEKIEVVADGDIRYFNVSMFVLIGMSWNYTCFWNWREYRGEKLIIRVYLRQGINQSIVVTTPSEVLLRITNSQSVFNLQDKNHFNITLQNHQSSLYAVKITKIKVQETGEIINVTEAKPIEPNSTRWFYCNISDWSAQAGENLTLTVFAVANETAKEYTFNFTFTLPAAELKITNVTCVEINGTKYLNITVENMNYSVWNLTIAKIIIVFPEQTKLEQILPANQIRVEIGGSTVILCAFDWGENKGDITVKVISSEGIETPPYPYTIL